MKKLVALLAMFTLVLVPATAAHASTANQCLIITNGEDQSGNFVIQSFTCYNTFAEVLHAASPANSLNSGITANTVTSETIEDTGIIGVHYDGANGTGVSVSVEGSDCNGGGLNLPASWNDKISSTLNGCPNIAHYHDANYGGATFVTSGVGSTTNIIGSMNNQTTSIKYNS